MRYALIFIIVFIPIGVFAQSQRPTSFTYDILVRLNDKGIDSVKLSINRKDLSIETPVAIILPFMIDRVVGEEINLIGVKNLAGFSIATISFTKDQSHSSFTCKVSQDSSKEGMVISQYGLGSSLVLPIYPDHIKEHAKRLRSLTGLAILHKFS